MNTLIFRTFAPLLVAIMVVFSFYVLFRGHNEPGGGFIGGLIAVSALAIYALAAGRDAVRRAMILDPMAFAGIGVLIAGLSGLLSVFIGAPFMTSLWAFLHLGETEVALSTPMVFDIGVYLVVFGTLTAVALALFEGEEH